MERVCIDLTTLVLIPFCVFHKVITFYIPLQFCVGISTIFLVMVQKGSERMFPTSEALTKK
jgi:hypothetical protein